MIEVRYLTESEKVKPSKVKFSIIRLWDLIMLKKTVWEFMAIRLKGKLYFDW